MTHFYNQFTLVLICLWLICSCDIKPKQIDTSNNVTPQIEKKITVFGSENCDHCIEFRAKMDSLNISYVFKDAEASEEYYQELLFKIQRANFKGYVAFPVIEIDDKIYVKPEFNEVLALLSK